MMVGEQPESEDELPIDSEDEDREQIVKIKK